MEKICKNCKYSETYTEKDGWKSTGEIDSRGHRISEEVFITNRKCNKLYNSEKENIHPRLDNEYGYTCVDSIDVEDDFGCILFEQNL